MSEIATPVAEHTPSLRHRLIWKWRSVSYSLLQASDIVMRRLGYARMEQDTNYVSHAMREFRACGWDLDGDKMQRLMCQQVCELLRVFSTHGHSGSSAPYAINMFTKLAKFEPLCPLTGADDEWNEVAEGVYQNNRCSHVFKDKARFDGQPYDIDAVIFRDPDGSCFTNGQSAQPITFPYTPMRKYVDRPHS